MKETDMRDIKFRGKHIDTGEWFYGDLLKQDFMYSGFKCFIVEEFQIWADGKFPTEVMKVLKHYEVIPESVGQYAGLKDKNGKEIYEGDICRNGDWDSGANAYNYRVEQVCWSYGDACFAGWDYNIDGTTCEVIGNIHETPELIER